MYLYINSVNIPRFCSIFLIPNTFEFEFGFGLVFGFGLEFGFGLGSEFGLGLGREVYKGFALFLSSSCVSCFSMTMLTGLALVYVDRLKVLHFSMSIFALFSVYILTGSCNYGVMFFYVLIFNPDVYSILMYIL